LNKDVGLIIQKLSNSETAPFQPEPIDANVTCNSYDQILELNIKLEDKEFFNKVVSYVYSYIISYDERKHFAGQGNLIKYFHFI